MSLVDLQNYRGLVATDVVTMQDLISHSFNIKVAPAFFAAISPDNWQFKTFEPEFRGLPTVVTANSTQLFAGFQFNEARIYFPNAMLHCRMVSAGIASSAMRFSLWLEQGSAGADGLLHALKDLKLPCDQLVSHSQVNRLEQQVLTQQDFGRYGKDRPAGLSESLLQISYRMGAELLCERYVVKQGVSNG